MGRDRVRRVGVAVKTSRGGQWTFLEEETWVAHGKNTRDVIIIRTLLWESKVVPVMYRTAEKEMTSVAHRLGGGELPKN